MAYTLDDIKVGQRWDYSGDMEGISIYRRVRKVAGDLITYSVFWTDEPETLINDNAVKTRPSEAFLKNSKLTEEEYNGN